MATVIHRVCRLVRVRLSRPHKTGGVSELYLWEYTLDVVCETSCIATSIFRIHVRRHAQPQITILRHLTNSGRLQSTPFGTTQWAGEFNEDSTIARGAEKARAHNSFHIIRSFNPSSVRFHSPPNVLRKLRHRSFYQVALFEQVMDGSEALVQELQVRGNIGHTLRNLQLLRLFFPDGICSTAVDETLFVNRSLAEE